MSELLTINSGESFIMTAVDNHIQSVAVLTHKRQSSCDERLMLNRIESSIDTELFCELAGIRAKSVDEMFAMKFNKLLIMIID